MARNLDLTALRSFVAIADAGGVTRAAGFLNLTQSAVSMQIKRLEESLGLTLLDRGRRGVSLSPSGEQLLGYARRMLVLNDEVLARLTSRDFEGEVVIGVPHDVVYPAIPQVLQRLAADFPRVKVQLVSSFTNRLLRQFDNGEVDVIVTTEDVTRPGGTLLAERSLIWVGAPGGQVWRQRPLRLAYEHECIFRHGVQRRLDEAGIPWEMAVDSNSSRTIEATVSADLAVHTMIAGTEPRHFEAIVHGGALPELRNVRINLYARPDRLEPVISAVTKLIRQAYDAPAVRIAAE